LIAIIRFFRGWTRRNAAAKLKFVMDKGGEDAGRAAAEKLAVEFKKGDWQGVGNAIGEAIGKGVATGLGKEASKIPILGGLGTILEQAGAALPAALREIKENTGERGRYASAAGGIFTRPTLTWVGDRGPEAVVPLRPGNTAPGASPLPGGGNTVNITINGATDVEEVDRRVRRALSDMLVA
jgi:hypothetical protein